MGHLDRNLRWDWQCLHAERVGEHGTSNEVYAQSRENNKLYVVSVERASGLYTLAANSLILWYM